MKIYASETHDYEVGGRGGFDLLDWIDVGADNSSGYPTYFEQ